MGQRASIGSVCSLCLALFLLFLAVPVYAAKVAVCHIPPGNPENAHTIYISKNAVAAHEGYGDEVFESDVCFAGQGECMSEGVPLCTSDGIRCDAIPGIRWRCRR